MRKVMNLPAMFVLITFVVIKFNRASSHDALLVFTPENIFLSDKVELPYKATESNGEISYPEIEQDKRDYMHLCHPRSAEALASIKRSSEFYPDDIYCLVDYTLITPISQLFGLSMCPTEVKPLFTDEINHEEDYLKDCGTSVNHTLYHFGFNYCKITTNDAIYIPVTSQLLSIYDICFDTNKSKPFWTKHQIQTGAMLKYPGLPSQRLGDEIKLSTEAFASRYKARSKDVFQKQAEEYKNQGPTPTHKMIPQQLVPHEDIAIKLWKKTTTHYVNTAPLWETLVPVMKAINNGIRDTAIKINVETYDENTKRGDNLDIYTTTYSHESLLIRILHSIANVLHLRKEPFGWNIWCKFIHYRNKNQGIMIFLHNLPDNPPVKADLTIINQSPEESSIKQTEPKDEDNYSNKQTVSSSKPDEKTENSKTNELLKEKECETPVACDFEKWFSSNQPEQGLSNDLLKYAYCCEVNKKKVDELFGIKLENEITLLDIDDIITKNTEG